MLIPNTIPTEEPQIDVGIILPEDNILKVKLTFPSDIPYNLKIDDKLFPVPKKAVLMIKLENDNFILDMNKIPFSATEFTILPLNQKLICAKSGIKVSTVKAGRGFHWQKNIDVYLPGSIAVKKRKQSLIMINSLPLEHYVMCVATSEMSAKCPPVFIEAQTIAARSWILANIEHKHAHLEMDVCNDDCCQRYQGTTFLSAQSQEAALNTTGKVLIFRKKICDARYSKSCGGMTESYNKIWPGNTKSYLTSKPDSVENPENFNHNLSDENIDEWLSEIPDTFCSPKSIAEKTLKNYLGSVDEKANYFRWKIILNQEKLINSLKEYAGVNVQIIERFDILSRGNSGRITRLKVYFKNQENKPDSLVIKSEYNIRRFLSSNFLYSSAFKITPQKIKNEITREFKLLGAGWGHGVGMCQIGALGMALRGYEVSDILLHYYPGSKITTIY